MAELYGEEKGEGRKRGEEKKERNPNHDRRHEIGTKGRRKTDRETVVALL